MTTAATADEPIPLRTDSEKGIQLVFLRHMAHVGMMLQKLQRQNKRAEKIEKFASTGEVKDLELTPEEEADMGVNIGNESHYHFESPQTTAAAPVATPAPPAAPAASPVVAAAAVAGKASKLLPLALIAGSLLGGTGLGVLVSTLGKSGTTPSPAAVDTDSDTITEIDFPTH